MKLLIVTQKVDINDDVLGFFHDWILEFARQCERVTVVCLEKGEYDLPDNVRVLSLGKEKKDFRFKILDLRIFRKIRYFFILNYYSWKERQNYDRVLVHMIPEYVLAGAGVWKILGKRIGLWYAHGSVAWPLRLASFLASDIFTSTASGCRLKTSKLQVVGQGIDVGRFSVQDGPAWGWKNDGFLNIVIIGRIAPVKDYETLIQAIDILATIYKIRNIKVRIVGGTLLEEHDKYLLGLKDLSKRLGLEKKIEFVGAVPYKDIKKHLSWADIMASTSRTGSLDKAMLEAMSASRVVLTCNQATEEVLGVHKDKLFFKAGSERELSEKIKNIFEMEVDEYKILAEYLREKVETEHGLRRLVTKILKNV